MGDHPGGTDRMGRASEGRGGGAGAGALVVVESPAKGKTLQRLLGPGFTVRASCGHVKDLAGSGLGVDPGRDFAVTYELVRGKARVLSDLKRAARRAGRVYLATDPDREGEAIAWHVAEELGAADGDARVRRVLFHEITPAAVREALEHPRDLDRRRYDAQQARRVLDRLVGFEVSELLWKKVKRGLSAGRVQSVTVRLVVEREREIEAFRPEESWTIDARLAAGKGTELRARLVSVGGAPARPGDGEAARRLAGELERAGFAVAAVERRERLVQAPAPFTTASLQEEAGTRLGFTPRRTMSLAQRLYEGVELGEEGLAGLITYVRTDSVRLSAGAVAAARALVASRYGEDHLPAEPNAFRGRGRAAQDAHEAVRPASVERTPERVKPLLAGAGGRDLFRLYELVWRRFVACQMAPAALEETAVHVEAGPGKRFLLRAEGTSIRFPGWLAAGGAPQEVLPLPPLAVGQALRPIAVEPGHEFSSPPDRFTEATLVREMEARGLGRPSTYASVIETIQERRYVERDGKGLLPTALGRTVTDFLVGALPKVMDVAFTAAMEARLDDVEEGSARWQAVVAELHGPFREELGRAGQRERPGAAGHPCPRCGKPLALRFGRNGEFFACSGYPACRYTADPERGPGGSLAAADRSTGVECPKGCGGLVTERRSRTGKTFFGCSSYPGCDFVSWDRPRDGPCPDCGSAWIVERVSRKGMTFTACPNRECGYRGGVPSEP